MAASPASQRSREHLEDLLFAVDAARASVVLHVQTGEGSGEFSISRGVLRGAAYGEAVGAAALRAVLEANVLSYQVHQVTEQPPKVGPDGRAVDEGPRLSELLKAVKPSSPGRSGFYMRSRLVRTPLPLPADLSTLQAHVAERLGQGASPLDLVSKVDATPDEFVKALRVLVERGVVVPSAEGSVSSRSFAEGPASSRPFSATLPSERGTQPFDVARGASVMGGVTLLGGSTPFPNITERAQPDRPSTRKPQNHLGRTQMAGSFASFELAEPATLRDLAPPEAANRARAMAATISLASGPDDVPVPSRRFEAETLQELVGLNSAIHSSRKPILLASEELPVAEPQEPALPVVGRYEVLARIKSGGVGSVYLCRLKASSGFQRLFAMKVLRVGVVRDPLLVREFFREARVLSTLHHPNVIGIVDAGSEKEPYLVLDYVEGGSLFELCQESPEARDPAVVVAILLDALAGTAAVHQATDDAGEPLQLVHHDLTPHNLLVGVDGACRVADFGVARTGTPKAGDKQYGKPAYVAPERYLGAPGDHRSDLFSLGVVLYTALTGVNPFQGANSEEIRRRVLLGHVPPASTVGLRPPPCLDWICEKALAQKPSERFQSAEEMMVHLRRIAGREELIASPSQVAQWVRSVCRDRLEARRRLLRPTQPPPPAETEAPEAPGFEPAQAEPRALSKPPSSYATHEKTEALPSRPEAAPQPDVDAFPAVNDLDPTSLRRRKVTFYVAISAVLLVLVGLLFAPNWMSSRFSVQDRRDASGVKTAAPPLLKKLTVEKAGEKQESDAEVVIPEIRPADK